MVLAFISVVLFQRFRWFRSPFTKVQKELVQQATKKVEEG